MAEQKYSAIKQTDDYVVRAFRQIDIELGGNGESEITASLGNEYQKQVRILLNATESHEFYKSVLPANAALVFQFVFKPPAPPNSSIHVVREASADAISIRFQNDADATVTARFIAATRRHLPGLEATTSIDKLLGTELAEFYRRREAGLMQLEGVAQRLVEQNEEYRLAVDHKTEELRQKLVSEQQEFLENARSQYAEKENDLKKREDELEARKKEFDDRDSRHVRRQIRDDLKRNLAEREKQFKLSKATNGKRLWIHAQFWFLVIVSASVAYSGFQDVGEKPDLWFPYVRSALGLLGLAASTIFYIRWSDDWFRQHANEEFRLRRLELDIDRASWVVEMALEWRQEKGDAIPPELIDRLTANIFSRTDSVAGPVHPAEQFVATLMNASANMKINLPGGVGEIGFDKKGMKQLAEAR